tara:strand:+ start:60 stop:305 length:246 start_codon:yes stop_codon:yes gene_type:complete
MEKLYYLLYQVIGKDTNWIVRVEIDPNNLLKYMDYISNIEVYKIYSRWVSTKYIDHQLEHNQFKIFNIRYSDELICVTDCF